MEEPINEASMELGLGDIDNSALRLLKQKASRLLPIYCIVFTIINRALHHYTRGLLVTAIASGMKTYLSISTYESVSLNNSY